MLQRIIPRRCWKLRNTHPKRPDESVESEDNHNVTFDVLSELVGAGREFSERPQRSRNRVTRIVLPQFIVDPLV